MNGDQQFSFGYIHIEKPIRYPGRNLEILISQHMEPRERLGLESHF